MYIMNKSVTETVVCFKAIWAQLENDQLKPAR